MIKFFKRYQHTCTAGGALDVFRQQNKLTLLVNNPAKKNALSMSILEEMDSVLSQLLLSKNIKCLDIKFNSQDCNVSCSGFDLHEFDMEDIAAGIDPLSSSHPACRVVQKLNHISEKTDITTRVIIENHLIGFGLILAPLCNETIWTNDKIKVFLPHFRMGVGFPLLPFHATLKQFGPLFTTELLIANKARTSAEVIRAIDRYVRLTKQEKERDSQYSIELIKCIKSGRPVIFDGSEYMVKDRTGNLQTLADLHIEQIKAYTQCPNFYEMPETVISAVEKIRLETINRGLAQSIEQHRQRPKEMNREESRSIKP